MNNLKLVDSSKIETYFKNGYPKYSGTTKYYKHENEEYAFLTGKHIRYYKDGARTEGIYDSWGSILENKYFDKKGNLTSELKTLTLDTNAKSVQEFDLSDKHITFVIKIENYKYSTELNKWFLYLEKEYTNGNKSGTWKYYFPNGELKKVKKQ